MSNRFKLKEIQIKLIANRAVIDKIFDDQKEFDKIRNELIFQILKDEKILSQSDWDVVRDGSVFLAHLKYNEFVGLNELTNFDYFGGSIYYKDLELTMNDNEVELVIGAFKDIPNFIAEHNLTVNGKNFITQRDILKSEIELLEEIIKLLGL